MSYKQGSWYVYCDICGQRSQASESTKLSTYTGHGGNSVCRHDRDRIDPGLQPFTPRKVNNVSFVRPNHFNTNNGTAIVDLESMAYQYYLVSSQDDVQIVSSQDDAWIISETAV